MPTSKNAKDSAEGFIRRCLRLARRARGRTSPNPMVGAVLLKKGIVIGEGYHRRAGEAHAEVEALRAADRQGHSPKGATLYVSLEPCSTQGRTPPCTDAIIAAGIGRVVFGATDPKPRHAGRAVTILRGAGIEVDANVLESAARKLNEPFNHWVATGKPWVTVKAAMTLDGKIATAKGESKWITGEKSRGYAMGLRRTADAILTGINTILSDDPSLNVRTGPGKTRVDRSASPRRIILDSKARIPLGAKVLTDELADRTVVAVTAGAPKNRVKRLGRIVTVWNVPDEGGRVNIDWVLERLGREEVVHLLVEGGGEVNAAFLLANRADEVAFFYAPLLLGGADARKAVAGSGINEINEFLRLSEVAWRRIGDDLLLRAHVHGNR